MFFLPNRNKRCNEKRRREQENFYIEELAALIATERVGEMNSLSVKPDKCAILQESVKQIQQINRDSKCAVFLLTGKVFIFAYLTLDQVDDLQESQVSSSRPHLLTHPEIGHVLLDAFDCFMFTLNPEGQIDFISDNVARFLKFESVCRFSFYLANLTLT